MRTKAVAVGTVLALLVVGCGSTRHTDRRHVHRGTGPLASFLPMGLDALNANDWWLVGTRRCGRHQCGAIIRTLDGGRHFELLNAPPPGGEAANDTIAPVFANPRDGYDFDVYHGDAFVTHNGGASWVSAGIGPVDGLAVSGGWAYAIESPASTNLRLVRAPVDTNHWTVAQAGLPMPPDAVAAVGLTVYVWLRDGTIRSPVGHLYVSHDHGGHFERRAVLGEGDLYCKLAPVPGQVVWALCDTGNGGYPLRSDNGGRSFTALANPPGSGIGCNCSVVAPASADDALIETPGMLSRTTNGGITYVHGGRFHDNWDDVTALSHGLVVGLAGTYVAPSPSNDLPAPDHLYVSHNGGVDFRSVPIQ